jgi:hypothetical protein
MKKLIVSTFMMLVFSVGVAEKADAAENYELYESTAREVERLLKSYKCYDERFDDGKGGIRDIVNQLLISSLGEAYRQNHEQFAGWVNQQIYNVEDSFSDRMEGKSSWMSEYVPGLNDFYSGLKDLNLSDSFTTWTRANGIGGQQTDESNDVWDE